MFKKLLKYDLKSLLAIWWIGAVSILVLAIPTGFCLRTVIMHNTSSMVITFCTLWIWVYIMLLGIFNFFGSVLIFIRFYSNFFRDEGYLTFTLPVKRQTLYLSKVTSGAILNLLSGITIALAVSIVFLISPTGRFDDQPFFISITYAIGKLFGPLFAKGDFWLLFYVILTFIISILSSIFSTITIYFFITLGSTLVKKHKLLTTIGIMYGSSFISSMFTTPAIILVIMWFSSVSDISNVLLFGSNAFNPFVTLIFFFIIAIQLTLITLLSLIITGTLERKLNLQ